MKGLMSKKKHAIFCMLAIILVGIMMCESAIQAKTKITFVKFNKTYKTKLSYELLDDKVSGTYSIKVEKVKSIKKSQFDEYKINPDKALNYKLVKLTVTLKDVKIKKVKGEGAIYQNMLFDGLSLWGTKTADNDYVIGTKDFGFDGCLDDAIDDVVGLEKLSAGKKLNATATGYVVVGVYKGQTSYFIAKNPNIEDYESSLIRFKLK